MLIFFSAFVKILQDGIARRKTFDTVTQCACVESCDFRATIINKQTKLHVDHQHECRRVRVFFVCGCEVLRSINIMVLSNVP